ncbi:MAG TPA: TIGR03768 family metallophosphoesterase [Rhodoferax sp.]|nr:TIGR03768 family metallophosphoesterase [Rhodoferax sp.]
MNDKKTNNAPDFRIRGVIGRREFLRYGLGTSVLISSGTSMFGCGGSDSVAAEVVQPYLIDSTVTTTTERMISFPYDLQGLSANEIDKVAKYDSFGYGAWTFGTGLPVVQRVDLMPVGYHNPNPKRNKKFANFFTFSDIHITDKEAPNQLMLLQEFERYAINNTSIYSPVMMYTTHVLDAAMQTMNVLHKKNPFDFALSLGDTCNSTSYNELRWYMDVIDGKVITPSSGAHLGADTIDYQKPYQAVGLDKSIPWYQTMGNHDHFMIGSFPVDADPSLGFRASYVADTVWAVADTLTPNLSTFPVLFNMQDFKSTPQYYMGLIDGSTPFGNIIHTGLSTSPVFAKGAPKVAADPDRRSLLRTEWVQEFFKTSSGPVGHGFNLVDKNSPPGFTCYSFLPRADVPLKVIVLDDTQSENDGSKDIHGHGYLDAARWTWLKAELAAGQAANQLMIIAAHVPIGVATVGTEMEWWLNDVQMATATAAQPQWWLNEPTVAPAQRNATTLTELVTTLQATPNLIMWMAGHRHFNTVKAFKSTNAALPEQGFWHVETSSLRDFPQQLRTFEIYLNSDYTISVVTINVDPAVAAGTPAATSRKYAVAVQQMVKNNLLQSSPNAATMTTNGVTLPMPTIDPTLPQAGDAGTSVGLVNDPSIQFTSLKDVPYNASYNAELFKQLSPAMVAALKARFPA